LGFLILAYLDKWFKNGISVGLRIGYGDAAFAMAIIRGDCDGGVEIWIASSK
jgi:hypothetical protein